MKRKVGPYVGVTGFTTQDEVTLSLGFVPHDARRKLMVGVLMSSKTLRGEENSWPNRYPKREVVPELFLDHPKALNLIHYNTDNPNRLYEDLISITKLAGPNLHGFQLNIEFPDRDLVEEYLMKHPSMYIVLQVGSKMLELEPVKLRSRISIEYSGMVDTVLIDSSGGVGQPLDASTALRYLEAFEGYRINLGIAGGLGPSTMNLLGSLPKKFRNLSIDAQGRLRTPKPEDKLDIGAVESYLQQAFNIFA